MAAQTLDTIITKLEGETFVPGDDIATWFDEVQRQHGRMRDQVSRREFYSKLVDLLPDGAADDRDAVLVPEGHLFMMGDNRDRSADSRFPAVEGGGIGLVPEKNLVGKALVSVFSTDGSANWLLPWTWFTAARWSRIGEGF